MPLPRRLILQFMSPKPGALPRLSLSLLSVLFTFLSRLLIQQERHNNPVTTKIQ